MAAYEQPAPIYPTQDYTDSRGSQPPSGMSTPSSGGPITRTVAIIKNHALQARFDIEGLISEAKFEIVKERQMEFDTETDPETLFELFGQDAECFSEGPVWVYVLERRRAIQTWQELMGNPDPAIAQELSPRSIRALYGISASQNAVMGSADSSAAEIQIASLFASSPPFPTTDLPDEDGAPSGRYGSMRSISSSILSSLKRQTSSNGSGSVNSPTSNRLSSGKSGFRARNLPSTHASPDIAPRMTKAAALRQGIKLEKSDSAKFIPTKDELKQIFMDVPGHKRSGTIAVASTAPPSVAPRMTRAAALRLGINPEQIPKSSSRTSMDAKRPTFEGVPGHKRRETISVASTRQPTMTPRANKSAALRASKEKAPPSSFMFRGSSAASVPRSNSSMSLNSNTGKPPSRPPSAASVATSRAVPRQSLSRSASLSRVSGGAAKAALTAGNATSARPAITNSTNGENKTMEAEKPKLRSRPSSIGAPTIAPRMNKSAALRAEKKAQEEAAAAAKAAKMKPRRPGSILS
jgi:nucleoside diphosphate kinase